AGGPGAWYSGHSVATPKGDRVMVCHSYGCARRVPLALSGADVAKLQSMLAAGKASPAAEREAVSHAVQWYERKTAALIGGTPDRSKTEPSMSGVPGQMDCVDEATNTTSLLVLASERGLLAHHRVGAPVARGFFLDGRYPHVTAVLVENDDGRPYAVDSWPGPNAAPPEVMTLDKWFATWSSGGPAGQS
ncbi:MAG TPA: hypothetical protein PLJ34_03360, partial [Hyphomicrobiales bacterium]|nr:hypothetical protein [Hyphomicrobiales bacterium]